MTSSGRSIAPIARRCKEARLQRRIVSMENNLLLKTARFEMEEILEYEEYERRNERGRRVIELVTNTVLQHLQIQFQTFAINRLLSPKTSIFPLLNAIIKANGPESLPFEKWTASTFPICRRRPRS